MATNGNQTAAETKTRYAVVTGANKGIGFETVRQLASNEGFIVILTARDDGRGMEAVSKLRQSGFSNVVFHQLDVLDPNSIRSLAQFIQHKFGRLDVLVNNAGASGFIVDEAGLKALNIDLLAWFSGKVAKQVVEGVIKQTYEKAEECLNTNYYGIKRVTEALLPLLQLSSSATVVNVSSCRSELKRIPNESIRNELGNLETLTEDDLDAILKKFLRDFKENAIEANGWTIMLPSYSISKAVLNAYTRILAKRYPNMHINCVHPGSVNTDITCHTGTMTLEEGAKGPVKCALIEDEGPTGCYFDQTEVSEF